MASTQSMRIKESRKCTHRFLGNWKNLGFSSLCIVPEIFLLPQRAIDGYGVRAGDGVRAGAGQGSLLPADCRGGLTTSQQHSSPASPITLSAALHVRILHLITSCPISPSHVCHSKQKPAGGEALTLLSLILDSIWSFCNMQSSTEEGEVDLHFHRLVYCMFACLKSGGTFRHCLLGIDISLFPDFHPFTLK